MTVPSCVVKVLPATNVPVTSLTIKWALGTMSGGLDDERLNPASVIDTSSIAPISLVDASSLALLPDVEVTVTVGRSVYPVPLLLT